jgi:hypothetical protein
MAEAGFEQAAELGEGRVQVPVVNGGLIMYRRGGAKMYHSLVGGLST